MIRTADRGMLGVTFPKPRENFFISLFFFDTFFDAEGLTQLQRLPVVFLLSLLFAVFVTATNLGESLNIVLALGRKLKGILRWLGESMVDYGPNPEEAKAKATVERERASGRQPTTAPDTSAAPATA